MKKLIILFVLSFGLIACKTTEPVRNVESASVLGEQKLSDVKNAIITALEYKRWSINDVTDSKIEAEIWVRSHYAKIDIAYSTDNYSINYVGSENLDADGDGNIHRNYNKWIILLDQEVRRNMRRNLD